MSIKSQYTITHKQHINDSLTFSYLELQHSKSHGNRILMNSVMVLALKCPNLWPPPSGFTPLLPLISFWICCFLLFIFKTWCCYGPRLLCVSVSGNNSFAMIYLQCPPSCTPPLPHTIRSLWPQQLQWPTVAESENEILLMPFPCVGGRFLPPCRRPSSLLGMLGSLEPAPQF